MDLQGKKVLVFGAGISGIGSCGLLEKEGAEVILYDGNDKKDAEAELFRKRRWKVLIWL